MAIIKKTREQIEMMRRSGRIVHETLGKCGALCQPGVTTAEINEQAELVLLATGAKGLFKNYPSYRPGEGFPAVTCISVNEEVVHGIPGNRELKDGDIVSIDFGISLDGWCGDSARTFFVGNVRPEVRKMCEATEHVLQIAIENIRPGRQWSQIARLMQNYAERQGYGVVRDFVGHGIGEKMHEDPKVPNYVDRQVRRNDILLQAGMVLAIEPMCTLGSPEVQPLADQWTIVTIDGQAAAHYEHTVAVTEDGCEVLTDGN